MIIAVRQFFKRRGVIKSFNYSICDLSLANSFDMPLCLSSAWTTLTSECGVVIYNPIPHHNLQSKNNSRLCDVHQSQSGERIMKDVHHALLILLTAPPFFPTYKLRFLREHCGPRILNHEKTKSASQTQKNPKSSTTTQTNTR